MHHEAYGPAIDRALSDQAAAKKNAQNAGKIAIAEGLSPYMSVPFYARPSASDMLKAHAQAEADRLSPPVAAPDPIEAVRATLPYGPIPIPEVKPAFLGLRRAINNLRLSTLGIVNGFGEEHATSAAYTSRVIDRNQLGEGYWQKSDHPLLQPPDTTSQKHTAHTLEHSVAKAHKVQSHQTRLDTFFEPDERRIQRRWWSWRAERHQEKLDNKAEAPFKRIERRLKKQNRLEAKGIAYDQALARRRAGSTPPTP